MNATAGTLGAAAGGTEAMAAAEANATRDRSGSADDAQLASPGKPDDSGVALAAEEPMRDWGVRPDAESAKALGEERGMGMGATGTAWRACCLSSRM